MHVEAKSWHQLLQRLMASLHASTDLGVPCESPALVALPPLADQHRRYLYAGPSFGHLTPRNSREGSFSLIAATL